MTSPQYEPWSPVQCEQELMRLFHAVGQCELEMRKLLETETDAKWEYERAHVIASTDPNCPVPSRSTGVTVGERESWIRGMVQDEFQGLEYAQLNVNIQKRYATRLDQQISIVQTMAKLVLASYATVGARER